MENVRAERSAGWSVIAFVGLLLLATVVSSPLPPVTMRAEDLAGYMDAHRNAILWAAWLTFPATACFLWFLVGLRSYLRQAPGTPEGLATYAMIAGVVMSALAFLGASLESAVAYPRPEVFLANNLATLYTAFIFLQSGLGYAPVAIFAFAVAHSMRRHHSAPSWLVWLGYAAAIGAGIGSLSIFYANSPLSPNGAMAGFFGAILSAVWLVALGVTLVRTRGQRSFERPSL